MDQNFLDVLPYWSVYAILFVALSLSAIAGFRFGEAAKDSDRKGILESKSAPGATALGGMLALIGFILAFTFGIAGGQYEHRRSLVIQDANAVGTAYLRAGLLPEPHASISRRLIGEYAARRHQVDDTAAGRRDKLVEEEAMHGALWAEAAAAASLAPTPIVSIYIQALNDVIDLHAERVHTIRKLRIPDLVFITLAGLSILALFVIGYHLALAVGRFFIPSALLVLTYTMVFGLVIDLDRPRGGFFVVNQQPMIDAADAILADLEARPPD